MPDKIIKAITALVAIYWLGTQTALAAPMLCSGEEKTCITVCRKGPPGLTGDCIAACRQRGNYCKHTGCWDSGTNRYCGLGRQ